MAIVHGWRRRAWVYTLAENKWNHRQITAGQFGTLSISDHGISRFFGPTGGSECFGRMHPRSGAAYIHLWAHTSPFLAHTQLVGTYTLFGANSRLSVRIYPSHDNFSSIGVRERLLMAQIPIADAERLLPVTNDYSLEPMPIAQSLPHQAYLYISRVLSRVACRLFRRRELFAGDCMNYLIYKGPPPSVKRALNASNAHQTRRIRVGLCCRHFGLVAAGNDGMVDGGGRRKEAVDRISPSAEWKR
ncbi:hypothetical protein B0H13DRAFT_1888151 [Mycena leptocephala]|nr:hypothetical protein B0H13DRAFT_1888151 [Mycena leptocephala]